SRAARGGAVPGRGQRLAGLGPVSGAVVVWLPPPGRHRDVGLQFPGLAGSAAAAATAPTGQTPPAFFPLGGIAGASPCRRCIGASATGSAGREPRNGCCLNSWWCRNAFLPK